MTLVDNPPVAAMESGGPATSPGELEPERKYHYETGPKPKHNDFESLLDRAFGLLNETDDRWTDLKQRVEALQAEAPTGVQYKVFFLGWHNAAADKYGAEGRQAMLTGDGEMTWGPDPELTPLGQSQAAAIGATWAREAPLGAPVTPDEMAWFVSPLVRTGQTMLGSWGNLLGSPEVWEDWREIYGSHTCDKRNTLIRQRFPHFRIEPGFAEADELWKPDERETDAHMQLRGRRAFDRVFATVDKTYISVTAHSAILRNCLAVINHQPYPLATGEMIPVVLKATEL